jgi:hypothetical protein
MLLNKNYLIISMKNAFLAIPLPSLRTPLLAAGASAAAFVPFLKVPGKFLSDVCQAKIANRLFSCSLVLFIQRHYTAYTKRLEIMHPQNLGGAL